MNNLSLTACSIWIREKKPKGKKNEVKIMNLNKTISGKEKNYDDFFDIIEEFCTEYKKYVKNKYDEKMFKIDTEEIVVEETEKFRYTYLNVRCGGYGIDADIVSTQNNKVTYKRKRNEAEILNFKIFFAVPKGEDVCKGIILFQNLGQYGIKTISTYYIRNFINDKLNLMAVIGNICPEIFVKKLLDCKAIKKIIYIRNNISDDKSDTEQIGYGKEERVITNFININGWKEKILSYLNSKNGIYEFENIDYTGFKMQANINGRERMININNIDSLSIIEGIPNEVMDTNRKY